MSLCFKGKANPGDDPKLAPPWTRLTFTMYTTDQFFLPDKHAQPQAEGDVIADDNSLHSKEKINSMVVSASINGVKVTNLTQPIEMVFMPKQVNIYVVLVVHLTL